MAKREVYMSGMKARLAQWNAQLEALKAKDGDPVKADNHRQLDAWKAAANGIADKLAELKAADERWYVIKAELEKAVRGIEAALGPAEPAKGPTLVDAEPPVAPAKPRQTA